MPEIEDRLKRVDAALATQLQRSMEKNARLVAKLAIARKALEDIAGLYTGGYGFRANEIARAAIKEIEP